MKPAKGQRRWGSRLALAPAPAPVTRISDRPGRAAAVPRRRREHARVGGSVRKAHTDERVVAPPTGGTPPTSCVEDPAARQTGANGVRGGGAQKPVAAAHRPRGPGGCDTENHPHRRAECCGPVQGAGCATAAVLGTEERRDVGLPDRLRRRGHVRSDFRDAVDHLGFVGSPTTSPDPDQSACSPRTSPTPRPRPAERLLGVHGRSGEPAVEYYIIVDW
jgi:hypothetical protein